MVLFGFASLAWLLGKAAELRVCQTGACEGLKRCQPLPFPAFPSSVHPLRSHSSTEARMSSPALSSELFLFRADGDKKSARTSRGWAQDCPELSQALCSPRF